MVIDQKVGALCYFLLFGYRMSCNHIDSKKCQVAMFFVMGAFIVSNGARSRYFPQFCVLINYLLLFPSDEMIIYLHSITFIIENDWM